jgi:hypothetical protein
MNHIHYGSCGCAEEAKGPLELYDLHENMKSELTTCLNEAVSGSIKKVVRPYEARIENEHTVESDCDGEVLINIEFESDVKVKGITVRCVDKDLAPAKMSVYVP